jgi:hypothetical protein
MIWRQLLSLLKNLVKNKPFAIYGAQVVAYGAYTALKYLCGVTPECFIVSSLNNNPREIDGITVKALENIPNNTLIIIGVTELLQDEIIEILSEKGCKNTFKLTQRVEHLLMSEYFEKIGKFQTLDTNAKHTSVQFALYESHSKKDKILINPPKLEAWEIPINADDYPKNSQYCEMSAVRWIWQNADADWLGVEHYRRHLLVASEDLSDEIDVVLPLPYICYPNTIAQFRRFVSEDVLNALLTTLRTLHPSEYDEYSQILKGQYQYTYNLVAAKKSVFNAYCAWFFQITEHMEMLADKVPEIANTRALSYVAEVLTSLYFLSHSDTLNIRHAEKRIYT